MRRRAVNKTKTIDGIPEETIDAAMDDRSSMVDGDPEPGGVLGDVDALDAGDTVTIVWGKESFSPIRYFNVEVGPFRLTVRVRKGEAPGEAIARANRILEAHAEEAWRSKVRAHLDRCKDTPKIAEAMKARG